MTTTRYKLDDIIRMLFSLLYDEVMAFLQTNAECFPYFVVFLPLLAIPSFFLHPDGFTWVVLKSLRQHARTTLEVMAQAGQALREHAFAAYLGCFWILAICAGSFMVHRYFVCVRDNAFKDFKVLKKTKRREKKGRKHVPLKAMSPDTENYLKDWYISTDSDAASSDDDDASLLRMSSDALRAIPSRTKTIVMQGTRPPKAEQTAKDVQTRAAVESIKIASSPRASKREECPQEMACTSSSEEQTDPAGVVENVKAVVETPAQTFTVEKSHTEVEEAVKIEELPCIVDKPEVDKNNDAESSETSSDISNATEVEGLCDANVEIAIPVDPFTPSEIIASLRSPALTDHQLQLLVSEGRITPQVLSQMNRNQFLQAGIHHFVVQRMLRHVNHYSRSQNMDPAVRSHSSTNAGRIHPRSRSQMTPPPGFGAKPDFIPKKQIWRNRSSQMQGEPTNQHYEKNMYEISNQMSMNVLD